MRKCFSFVVWTKYALWKHKVHSYPYIVRVKKHQQQPFYLLRSCSCVPFRWTLKSNLVKNTSSLVGYLVILCSSFYKIPQIVRIMRKKSAKGISLSMYTLENIGIYFSLCYCIQAKFPWETFAENICIFLQNGIIMLLLHQYAVQRTKKTISGNFDYLWMLFYFLSLLLSISLLWSIRLPIRWLQVLQLCSSPLLNASKIPQILENRRNESTGELSPITLGFQLAGNIARVFTTLVQLQNRWYLASIFISLALNAILGFQYMRYRCRPQSMSSFKDRI